MEFHHLLLLLLKRDVGDLKNEVVVVWEEVGVGKVTFKGGEGTGLTYGRLGDTRER